MNSSRGFKSEIYQKTSMTKAVKIGYVQVGFFFLLFVLNITMVEFKSSLNPLSHLRPRKGNVFVLYCLIKKVFYTGFKTGFGCTFALLCCFFFFFSERWSLSLAQICFRMLSEQVWTSNLNFA